MELHEDGEFYGLWEGDKIHQYKVGYHEERKIGKTLDYFKQRLPSKYDLISHVHVCYYTITEDGNFQYRTGPDGVHLGYAFNGAGFKFLPIHGKIIYEELIKKMPVKY